MAILLIVLNHAMFQALQGGSTPDLTGFTPPPTTD